MFGLACFSCTGWCVGVDLESWCVFCAWPGWILYRLADFGRRTVLFLLFFEGYLLESEEKCLSIDATKNSC